ncbi:MAG: PKD domain-containing protein [Bacteroidia bacterium]
MKKAVILFFILPIFFSDVTGQTVTIGSGTNYNSIYGYPSPYAAYYYGARHQFIILASEIKANGMTNAGYINSISFNNYSPSGTTLVNYQVKISNTSVTSFTSGSPTFQSGMTTVFGPRNYADITGWNTHIFTSPFYWDGGSNLVVEICFNNSSAHWNSSSYYTSAGFNSTAYRYGNTSTNCASAAQYSSSIRPNLQFDFISNPIASFASADSIWVRNAVTFTNTSAFNKSSYWNISNVPGNRFCNKYGCFLDSNANLIRTFTSPGTYQVTLVVKNALGADSMKKNIVVMPFSQKPKANFYSSSAAASTLNQIFFYDSSLYGVTGWQWSLNPYCNNCGSGYPNTFSPSSTIKNTSLFLLDPGVFDVCLAVWNDIGGDTICKKSYLTVLQGYSMCNGTDSFSNLSSGYLYDEGGPTANYQVGLVGNCKSGFVISPSICTDTITLVVDQFRLRTNDTLQIRDGGTATSPLIAKLAGPTLSPSNKILKAHSGKMYLKMFVGSGNSAAGDTGFIMHWQVSPSHTIFSSQNFVCLGDSLQLKVMKKTNRTFTWKWYNYLLNNYSDSFCYAKYAGTYSVVIRSPECVDTGFVTLPAFIKAHSDFNINNVLQCVNNNQFVLKDTSTITSGTYSRFWRFGDNTTENDDSIAQKIYHTPGIFVISLITTSNHGCKDSTAKIIRLLNAPVAKINFGTVNNRCGNDSIQLYSANITPADKYKWYLNNNLIPDDSLSFTWTKAAGKYNLQITSDMGCDSISSPVTVSFKNSPAKPLITRLKQTLHSSSPYGNQWFLLNIAIPGANQQNFTPVADGNYSVMFTDSSGCSNLSSTYFYSAVNSVGAVIDELHIYPNPASSVLNISASEPVSFMITDVAGKILIQSVTPDLDHHVDVSTLSKGIYLVKLLTHEKTAVSRFEKF